MTNRYRGVCNGCKRTVKANAGVLERIKGKWVVWCSDCFDKSDNSGYEDRACGNRAYEDECARRCGGYEPGEW